MSTLEKFVGGFLIIILIPFALGVLLIQFIIIFLVNGWLAAYYEFFGD